MALIVTKKQFSQMIEDNFNKKYVFTEYHPDCPDYLNYYIMNNKGDDMGATSVNICYMPTGWLSDSPMEFCHFNYDWSLGEYNDNDLFFVLEDKEIISMIKLLTEALPDIID